MEQLQSIWRALDTRRRVVVLGTTIAVFVAILGLSRMVSAPSMSLLYAGLESGAAGDVVRALDQRGVTYQVRGDSIWVDASQRDSLRMTLAAEGLPANGSAGYELLDGLSGFGTTSQMFDAAYWRAKEGELARTIVVSPDIRAARVHISSSQPHQPFLPEARPTASVTVTTAQGSLPEAQIKALKYLVASAVSGLKPDDVAIIDSSGGLLEAGDTRPGGSGAGDDLAAELKHNVERLLAARVGAGKAVVEVSVDRVTERESIVEKHFDPKSRVAISSDSEEKTNSSADSGGTVSVASNLPNGDAGQGGSNTKSSANETRERVNYEVSQTQRELVRAPGAVRRISVAVLVDGLRTPGPDGQEVWAPRPDDELAALHDLVASAVGYDKARGDIITIKSLAFQPVPELGTVARDSLLARLDIDPMTMIQLGVLALVALVLGLFVLRPILTSSRAPRRAGLPAPDRGYEALPAGSDGARVLTGEIDEGDFAPGNLPMVASADFDTAIEGADQGPADPVARLRRLIEERQQETVEILRTWMEDGEQEEEKAT